MTDARVARLTLTAPDDDHVRRGAILVEDAMRIATMPAAARHRQYIVRHLDIGVIAADASPQTIALQIERRLEHAQLAAVPATGSSAAAARAVWFADEPTAIAELARRLVHARPAEWFWPHVAGGAVKLPSLREALFACLAAAARTEAGALAVAAVLDAIESERADAVLGSLEEREARALLAGIAGGATLDGPPIAEPEALARVVPRWRARVQRAAARWGPDVRALWVAALARIASRGAIDDAPRELARARALVFAALLAGASPEPPAASAPAPVRAQAPTAGAAPIRIARGERDAARAVRAPGEAVTVARAAWSLETTATTAAAGALFLIRPLAMLGLPEWLADHAWTGDVNWPAQLLAAIARAHGGAGDALALALCEDGALRDGPFVAPARWRALLGRRPHRLRPTASGGRVLEASGRLPIAAWRGAAPAGVPRAPVRRGPRAADRAWAAAAWRGALARWLREFARLRLRDVVCRTAELSVTPTHVDLIMPLDAVATPIRSAGLDVDPGWVPWLGRVVRFHYQGRAR